jgi:hypothetical protein
LALTLPITIASALFANDLILILLGPKWIEAIPIFQLLTPTILVFALINPMWWLLASMGLLGRSLRIALVIAPLVIAAYVIGLPYGPTGVAFAYSAVMTLWLVPHIAWCIHGTMISSGYLEGVESTFSFGSRGDSACLFRSNSIRRIAFSFSAAFVRSQYSTPFIPLDALVYHGTERFLRGSFPRLEETLFGRRERTFRRALAT